MTAGSVVGVRLLVSSHVTLIDHQSWLAFPPLPRLGNGRPTTRPITNAHHQFEFLLSIPQPQVNPQVPV